MSGALTEGLAGWARRRAIHLAEEYARDAAERESPAAFFDATCGRERLLASLRTAAEPAFMARVAELEAEAHGC